MKQPGWFLVVVLIFGGMILTGSAPALSQEAGALYKGKTVTFIVPYYPGGGYDFYARFMAPDLK